MPPQVRSDQANNCFLQKSDRASLIAVRLEPQILVTRQHALSNILPQALSLTPFHTTITSTVHTALHPPSLPPLWFIVDLFSPLVDMAMFQDVSPLVVIAIIRWNLQSGLSRLTMKGIAGQRFFMVKVCTCWHVRDIHDID